MTKTAEFGQPCKAPLPGTCRICGCTRITACDVPYIEEVSVPGRPGNIGRYEGSRACGWTDETKTLCDAPECIAAARAEIVPRPFEAEEIMRPQTGKRYGFAPRGRR